MVHLDKIYTRSGDRGKTSLGDGTRVSKTSPRIASYGLSDELGAALGVVVAACDDEELAAALVRVQNDLFDLGADLCVPRSDSEGEGAALRIQPAQVLRLEQEIDAANEELEPLQSFILAGGTETAARLHVARCVARRAELAAVALAETERVNEAALHYLNRISDWLFVMARRENRRSGREDVLWRPGGERG